MKNHGTTYLPILPHSSSWVWKTPSVVKGAQLRVLVVTILCDALAAWKKAPGRSWSDIGRLVQSQLRTLDRLYPESGILEDAVQHIAVQFFAANVDDSITDFVTKRKRGGCARN